MSSNAAQPIRFIALHATGQSGQRVALCGALELPAAAGDAPEWIHVLPAGQFSGADGRGPYRVADAAVLASASLDAAGGRLVIDENHSTDLAGPRGDPAPARGWLIELEARADGIWGKAEWNRAGRELMSERAYRHISPVITHTGDGTVTGILRASLINKPNLRSLTALHQENPSMDFIAKLRAALGLPDEAGEDAILAAIEKKKTTALQGALDPIALALGLQAGADQAAVLAGATALSAGKGDGDQGRIITALQGELATVTTTLNALQAKTKKDAAEAFVDGAIKAGRVGVKPMRDEYVAMHAENPDRVEKLINAMPILGHSGTSATPPANGGGATGDLSPEQQAVVKLMGIDAEDYKKTLAAEGKAQAAL